MVGHGRDDMPSSTKGDAADEFDEQLWILLRENPTGLSEYDLFALLSKRGDSRFDISALHDTFALFCSHFRLFNALYRLREKLWMQQRGLLEISPLLIIIRPYDALLVDKNQLGEVDALRDYYLDDTQLEQTTPQALAHMLDKFWARLNGSARRHQALAVLGLSDPVGASEIRHHYRRLAMEHHPDRGGDTACLQMINAAMAVLRE